MSHPAPTPPHTPAKKSRKKLFAGCCGLLILGFILLTLGGLLADSADSPQESATAPAPTTQTATPSEEATPAPSPTQDETATAAPAPTEEATAEVSTPASTCEAASPAVLETISGGLNDGGALTEGWIVKSDINELWYVSAPVPGANLIGVWIVTQPDGTGLTVSANSATANFSTWPDGTKSPKFEPVSGEGLDIVQEAIACAR